MHDAAHGPAANAPVANAARERLHEHPLGLFPSGRSERGTRIDEIDGLRAVAMTMVIAQHCGLLPFGWTGVWLFFVISGYVITRNFLNGQYAGGSESRQYARFMAKRFFRIVPVYLLYLFLNLLILIPLSRTEYLADIPFLVSFTYNWQMIFQFWPISGNWTPFGHLWTLSIEEQFYIVYPFLFLFLPRSGYVGALCLLAAAGPLVRLLYASLLAETGSGAGWIAFAVYAASFAQFDAFLMGALVANGERQIRARPWIAHGLAAAAAGLAAAYILSYAWVNYTAGARGIGVARNIVSGILYGEGRENFVYSVVALSSAAVLVYAILQKPFVRPLAWPWLSLVGRISYGGYLYHALILWAIGHALIPVAGWPFSLPWRLLLFPAVWLATVFVAYVSFQRFEKPVMTWANGNTANVVNMFRKTERAGTSLHP